LGHRIEAEELALSLANTVRMEGLTIRKKVMPRAKEPRSSSDLAAIPGLIIIAVLVLLALPLILCFLLLAWVIGIIQELLTSATPAKPRAIVAQEVKNPFFLLRYQYINSSAISAGAQAYFGDDELLIRYESIPIISFFDGSFSDFKLECQQGLFVQKVSFNATLTEVETMPLYFFRYATREAEYIHELKEYILETRGKASRFTIIADSIDDDGDDLEFEITLTDALYSPPKAY
jgi:hypothetical protein